MILRLLVSRRSGQYSVGQSLQVDCVEANHVVDVLEQADTLTFIVRFALDRSTSGRLCWGPVSPTSARHVSRNRGQEHSGSRGDQPKLTKELHRPAVSAGHRVPLRKARERGF